MSTNKLKILMLINLVIQLVLTAISTVLLVVTCLLVVS